MARELDGTTSARGPPPLAHTIGLLLLAMACVRCFADYAHWQGASGLLDLKSMCLSGPATPECVFFRRHIPPTLIPVYTAWLWYAGLVVTVVGVVQALTARKAR